MIGFEDRSHATLDHIRPADLIDGGNIRSTAHAGQQRRKVVEPLGNHMGAICCALALAGSLWFCAAFLPIWLRSMVEGSSVLHFVAPKPINEFTTDARANGSLREPGRQ